MSIVDFSYGYYRNDLLHTFIETIGAVSAVLLSLVIILTIKIRMERSRHIWSASALAGMGILNGLHAALFPGDAYVWLHTLANLIGSLVFIMVLLPKRYSAYQPTVVIPLSVTVLSSVLGLSVIVFPHIAAFSLEQNRFTAIVRSINILSGILFLAAAFRFYAFYKNDKMPTDLVFTYFCTLFSVTGLLFAFSAMMDVIWWFWHVLKISAFIVLLGYFVSIFYKSAKRLTAEIAERKTAEKNLLENKDRLRTAFEFSTLGIAITSPEKGWLRVNDELCTMMGYTREELTRMTWAEITHPGDLEPDVAQFNRVLSGELDGYSLDKRFIRKDGTVIYTTLWLNCKRGGHGNVDYFIAMLQDITGRKKMEEELRLQGEIIMNMKEGVVLIKATDSRIIYANPKFNGMFGYEDGELTDRDISIVNAPTDVSPEEVAEQIISEIKETGGWQGEVLNIKKDGTRFWCQAIVSTFKHVTHGTVWVSIHHDITKRKEAEQRIWETTERLRAIIDNSTAVIFLKDAEGKYLLINSRFEKLFNITKAEIIGKTVYDLYSKDVADRLWQNDSEVLLSLKPKQYIENVPQDNVMHVYLSIKFPIFDASAQAYGVCGIATDITPIKRNEEIIRTELARKSSIARVTEALLNPQLDRYDISKLVYEEALVLTGSKFGYASVIEDETGENAAVNTTDMPGIEFGISNDKPEFLPESPDGYSALWGHSLSTKEGFYTNNPSAWAADPSAWGAAPSASVADPSDYLAFKRNVPVGHDQVERFLSVPVLFNGNLIGHIALANPARDYDDGDLEAITRLAAIYAIALERKKAEDALRKEHDKRMIQEQMLIQQSKMAAMGEMISAIAHQWRQPLNAIAMITIDLEDAYEFGELDKEYLTGSLQKTMVQVEHMSATIDDFMNFFKPAKEKIYFNMNTAATKVIYMIYDQLKKAQINVGFDCKYDAVRKPVQSRYPGIKTCEHEITVFGYPNEFKQVLLNLLVNARDAILKKRLHTESASIADKTGEILIGLSKTEHTVILEIQDNGGGIPAEIIDRIFDPYFTTKGGAGTGIGLHMSKLIIEQNMGGRLSVYNGTKGAVFTIELPVKET